MSISSITFKKKRSSYMKEGRDFAIINRIDSHFNDLNDVLKEIDSFETFKK